MQISTVLRVIEKIGEYHTLKNISNWQPRGGDHLVYKSQCYTVMYTEFNFDNAVMYIVATKN